MGERKIASIGLNLPKGVCTHGLALNHGPDCWGFGLINPYGLGQGRITSIARETGQILPRRELISGLAGDLGGLLGLCYESWTLPHAQEEAARRFKSPITNNSATVPTMMVIK